MATSRADNPAIRTQVRAWVVKRVAVTFTVVSPFLRRHCGLSPGHRPPAPWIVGRRHVQIVLSLGVFLATAKRPSVRHADEAEAVRRRRDAGLRRARRPRAAARTPRAGARRPRSAASSRRASAPCGGGTSRPRRGTRARRRACDHEAASTRRRKARCCVSAGVKARKSCSPDDLLRAGREQLVRELARPVPGARRAQRRGRARAQHAVLVAARARREARVEALRGASSRRARRDRAAAAR